MQPSEERPSATGQGPVREPKVAPQSQESTGSSTQLPTISSTDWRRCDPRDRRKVRGQSGHGHRIVISSHLRESRALGVRTPAFTFLRLRRQQRPLRARLVPGSSGDRSENRQGPSAIRRLRRIRHLHPFRSGRPCSPAGSQQRQMGAQCFPTHSLRGGLSKFIYYRPRVEGLFARIERWVNQADPTDTFWRSIT